MQSELFFTKTGEAVPSVDEMLYRELLQRLRSEFHISDIQIAEAAAYSMAMVVRYALGLSASGGEVTLVVGDTLSGQIALATARHLFHGGALTHLFILGATPRYSEDFEQQKNALEALGMSSSFHPLSGIPDDLEVAISRSHNVICGLSGVATDELTELLDLLNDSPTPVHTIEAPLGVDLTLGTQQGTPLFASSTLSLGVPLCGLKTGRDFVGRHYVADISLPASLLAEYGFLFPSLFSEQPVQQILTELPG